MNEARSLIVGGIAGIVLAMSSSWLITGYLCHRFQQLTPATWRPEGWRQHALAVLWAGLGGAALGALDALFMRGHASAASAVQFGLLGWAALGAPVIATMATYIHLHRVVIAGLLLEWLVFAVGVALACHYWAT